MIECDGCADGPTSIRWNVRSSIRWFAGICGGIHDCQVNKVSWCASHNFVENGTCFFALFAGEFERVHGCVEERVEKEEREWVDERERVRLQRRRSRAALHHHATHSLLTPIPSGAASDATMQEGKGG